MNLAQVTEVQVQLFRFKANHRTKWKAQVIAFPHFTAEGNSREAVLDEIKEQLATLETESEVVRVPLKQQHHEVSTDRDAEVARLRQRISELEPLTKEVQQRYEPSPPLDEELAAKLREKGYEYFGAFADDPGALELFDEIERERDRHLIGE